MLALSFGERISDTDYLPLLYVLSDKLSFVDTARVVAAFSHRQYSNVLQDVFQCFFTTSEDSGRVKRRLVGYESWLVR